MAREIPMPRLSDTMEEGRVLQWYKQVGDSVKKGELLAEIETDKAVMDLESVEEGTLLELLVAEGGAAPLGAPNKACARFAARRRFGRERGIRPHQGVTARAPHCRRRGNRPTAG